MASPTTNHRESTEAEADRGLPRLEPGDRLTRAEFERRYEAMTQLKKAELIEGVVYMPAAVRYRGHGRPHWQLVTWLGLYDSATPGIAGADNISVRLDLDNEPQPDGVLFIEPERGGQVRIAQDDYVEGAPELAAEITSSRVSYDLGDKLNAYRRNGVKEYVVWRVLDAEIDWFVLREGRYVSLPADQDGVVHSQTFPGLWLDTSALLAGDMSKVLSVLQQGLSSREHAEFVNALEGRF